MDSRVPKRPIGPPSSAGHTAAPVSASVSCPHRPPCPGCPTLGQGIARAPIVERLAAFAAGCGARFELAAAAEPLGYRHRARLAIRGRAGSPKVGIFQAGSHRIVDIPRCLVHHPRVNEVVAALKAAIREAGLAPYVEVPHRGLLRYAQVTVDRSGDRVQLVVISNSSEPGPVVALWPALQARLGDLLQGLFWNGQPERGNAIVGPHWALIAGEPALDDRVAGVRVFLPPDAFAQNNPVVYEQVVRRIGGWVDDRQNLLEFYAGVGAIGLSLLPRARSVRFNELGDGSLRGLSRGLSALPADIAERADVLPGRAGDHADQVAVADLVIVDPPRKGLDPELLDALSASSASGRPRQLIYVSCGPGAFLVEAERLGARMPLAELVVFDLFPWTGHVELLARFATE